MVLAALRGNSNLDCLMALVLAVSVAIAFLPTENRLLTSPLVRRWSKITLNIYLLHEVFRTWIFPQLFPGKYTVPETMGIMVLYMVCVTAAAVLFEYLFRLAGRRRRRV